MRTAVGRARRAPDGLRHRPGAGGHMAGELPGRRIAVVAADGAAGRANTSGLERELAERVDGEVRFDAGSRAAYSTDGSNFRQVPVGVVVPRSVDAAVKAVAVCREHGVPVLSRGGGTSLAGQCTNEAIVLDWSKYCNRVVSVADDNQTCLVEPGIVLDVLNAELAWRNVRFGPEPATHMNCTLGGMIGNNSCGATAQRTGKVVDNVAALEVLLYDGTRFWCGPTGDEEYADIERRGDRRPRSTAGCAGCATPTPTRSGAGIRTSRAGSPATTWT